MKHYKVMAYAKSTGLWDTFTDIALDTLLGQNNSDLEAALKHWHDAYDDQFKQYPFDFDWQRFNAIGTELTKRIQSRLPPGSTVYYEPSDDREFFNREDCFDFGADIPSSERTSMLRARKPTQLQPARKQNV